VIKQLVQLLNGGDLNPEEEAELTGVAPETDEYVPPMSNIVDPWDESWKPPMPEIQHGSMTLPSAEESERAWKAFKRDRELRRKGQRK
jgi:hypothetical protein